MPDLGKATYKIEVDASDFQRDLLAARAEAELYSKSTDRALSGSKVKADAVTKAFRGMRSELAGVFDAATVQRLNDGIGKTNTGVKGLAQSFLDLTTRSKKGTEDLIKKIDETQRKITSLHQQLDKTPKLSLDNRMFRSAIRDAERDLDKLIQKATSSPGSPGGPPTIGSALSSFGSSASKFITPAGIALGAGGVVPLAGAASALIGSAGQALIGGGALGIGAGGIASVGLLPILAAYKAAAPDIAKAVKAQNAVTLAQTQLNQAVQQYGPGTVAAINAQNKLTLAQENAKGPMQGFAKQLINLKAQLKSSFAGSASHFVTFLGPLIQDVKDLAPEISKLANESLNTLGLALRPINESLRGSGFRDWLTKMEGFFKQAAPPTLHAIADMFHVIGNIAVTAGPWVVKVADAFERTGAAWVKATTPGERMNKIMSNLMSQGESWWNLLKALSKLVIDFFGAGAKAGKGLVDSLTGILGQWDAWIKANPEKISKFFSDSVGFTKQLFQSLAPIVKLFFTWSQIAAPTLFTAFRALAPVLTAVANALNEITKPLPGILKALPLIAAALTLKSVGGFIGGLRIGAGGLSLVGSAVASGGVAAGAEGALGGAAIEGAALSTLLKRALIRRVGIPLIAGAGGLALGNAVGAGSVGSDALAGAAAGTFIPGVGTLAGAGVGAGIGLLHKSAIGGGAAIGAGIGTIIGTPGVGTLIGAGLGAGVGALAQALGLLGGESRSQKNLDAFGKQIKELPKDLSKVDPSRLSALRAEAIRLAKDPSLKDERQHLLNISSALDQNKIDAQHWSAVMRKELASMQPAAQTMFSSFQNIDITGGSIFRQISTQVKSNMQEIEQNLGIHSKAGRDAMVANFGGAFSQIEMLYAKHEISTKKAVDAINALLAQEAQAIGGSSGHAAAGQSLSLAPPTVGFLGLLEKAVKHDAPLAAGQGMVEINKILANELKTIGGKPPAGLVTSASVFGIPTIGATFPSASKASGGFLGGPGLVGPDNMLIHASAGEAVLNRHQIPVVSAGLRLLGAMTGQSALARGLTGLFETVRKPHQSLASGGFVAEPGTNFAVGREPEIVGDLRKLADTMKTTIYGISGYRSPQHSVAVGGFADDPHTRGIAADIGVGAPTKASAYALQDSTLKSVGLYRPFFPAQAGEVNHVQPLGTGGAGSYGNVPAAATAAAIKHVAVHGIGGAIGRITQAAVDHAQRAANDFLGTSGFAGGGSGAAQSFARSHLHMFGWGADQWPPLSKLWQRESGWNPNAVNPSSGAMGIPQALGHGNVFKLGDIPAQVMWGLRYIAGRYGTPAAAWAHELASGWYGSGGWVKANVGPDPGPGFLQDNNGGKSFTEFGHRLTSILGALGGPQGMPVGSRVLVRRPGSPKSFGIIKNDDKKAAGLLAAGLHPAIASALGVGGIGQVEFSLPGRTPKPRKIPHGPAGQAMRLQLPFLFNDINQLISTTETYSPWSTALDNQFSIIDQILSSTNPDGTQHLALSDQATSFGGPSDLALINPRPGGLADLPGISWPTFNATDPKTGHPSGYDAEIVNRMMAISVLQAKSAGWQNTIAMIVRAVAERKRRQAEIHDFLAREYQRVKAIKAELEAMTTGDLKKRLALATSGEARTRRAERVRGRIKDLQKQLQNERALGQGAHPGVIKSLTDSIAAENTVLSDITRVPSNAKASAVEAIVRHNLQKELTGLSSVMGTLGGTSSAVGSGGFFGKITSEISTLLGAKTSFAQGVNDITSNLIPTIQLQIRGIHQNMDTTGVNAATQQSTNTSNSQLVALQQTQIQDLQRELAIANLQLPVFKQFVGSFAIGSKNIPATGLAEVHKGEAIIPADLNPFTGVGAGTGRPQIHIHGLGDFVDRVEMVINGKKQEISDFVNHKLADGARTRRLMPS